MSDEIPEYQPDFIQVPRIIYTDPDMQALDGFVYGVVYWYQHLRDGRCFASNKTIAKLLDSSVSGVANSLVRLRDKNYIVCLYDDNNQRLEIKALIYYSVNPYSNEEGGVTPQSNRVNNKLTRNSLSETEELKVKKLYIGYLRRFKIDPQDLASASTPEERAALIEVAAKRYKLTPPRKAKIVARLRDLGYDTCKAAINRASENDWNLGNNDRGWKADLADYIFRSYEQTEKLANS
jgi:DNA-binding Lrp family transcriptional regulator